MKDYMSDIEDRGTFWRVILINNNTGKPFTWINVDKNEFPTKNEAIDYLEDRYEAEKGIPMKDISEKNMRQMPSRMMGDFIDRKKKKTKPKLKKKIKRCKCK